MQLLKIEKRKGISPLIATLLLIAIAVAASVLTYSWVMSMIGSQSAQAQTQVRIDSAVFTAASLTIDVRNTGSVDAVLESVSVRTNVAGSQPVVVPDTTSIAAGTHDGVTIAGTFDTATSYVVRVTTNTGFYYEAVFSSPASWPT